MMPNLLIDEICTKGSSLIFCHVSSSSGTHFFNKKNPALQATFTKFQSLPFIHGVAACAPAGSFGDPVPGTAEPPRQAVGAPTLLPGVHTRTGERAVVQARRGACTGREP